MDIAMRPSALLPCIAADISAASKGGDGRERPGPPSSMRKTPLSVDLWQPGVSLTRVTDASFQRLLPHAVYACAVSTQTFGGARPRPGTFRLREVPVARQRQPRRVVGGVGESRYRPIGHCSAERTAKVLRVCGGASRWAQTPIVRGWRTCELEEAHELG